MKDDDRFTSFRSGPCDEHIAAQHDQEINPTRAASINGISCTVMLDATIGEASVDLLLREFRKDEIALAVGVFVLR